MSDVTIRQYESSDLEAARSLWQELARYHGEIYNDPSMGGEESRACFDKHLAQVGPHHVWLAEVNGEVVGLVSLIVKDQEAEVEPLIVASKFRGRGIGQSLLTYAIEVAKRLPVRYLNVKPVARNERAVSFFHAAGFTTLGHIQMFMELGPEARDDWKSGPELLGKRFLY